MRSIEDLAAHPKPVFFFDNNLSHKIPQALRQLGEPAYHLNEFMSGGADDLDWLPIVGRLGLTLLTMDMEIRRNPSEREAYVSNKVGGFALRGKDLSVWTATKAIVRHWDEMKRLSVTTPRPFIFRVRLGGKIEKPPLKL